MYTTLLSWLECKKLCKVNKSSSLINASLHDYRNTSMYTTLHSSTTQGTCMGVALYLGKFFGLFYSVVSALVHIV